MKFADKEHFWVYHIGEIRHGEIRIGEIRRGEIRVGEIRPGEILVGEIRHGEIGLWRDTSRQRYLAGTNLAKTENFKNPIFIDW